MTITIHAVNENEIPEVSRNRRQLSPVSQRIMTLRPGEWFEIVGATNGVQMSAYTFARSRRPEVKVMQRSGRLFVGIPAPTELDKAA